MLNAIDKTLDFHQTALRVRGVRQEVLAGNIANADTPGYRAKDLSFADAMAVARSAGPAAQGGPADVSSIARLVEERAAAEGSVDGNTVAVDQERNAFLENALRYEVSLTLVNRQIRGLLSAIQG